VNDREVNIQRQASMHFASRIVSAKIKRGETTEDKEIIEEVNRWMNKFQHGIENGQLPEKE